MKQIKHKVWFYYEMFRYMQIVKHKVNLNIDKGYNPLCQTYKQLSFEKMISKMWTNIQKASAQSTAPNTTRTISCNPETQL